MRMVFHGSGSLGLYATVSCALTLGCGPVEGMDPEAPARGPGQLVGNGDPVSSGAFRGGDDPLPEPRVPAEGETASDCGPACRDFCASLALQNPVNAGICPHLWGIGEQIRPIDGLQTCRRLFADLAGHYPSQREVGTYCTGASWGDNVAKLIGTDGFLLQNQRRFADKLLYNNRAVNFERAFDMDALVGKTFAGLVSWDAFAAVMSAHPVLVRRHDTPGDRAEFVYKLLLGRPPYESERGDLGRLYRLWNNGYWEHPHVGLVPDAFIDFACVDARGRRDPTTVGECTSISWGHNELLLEPDRRRMEHEGDQAGTMWSGYLLPDEWEKLQLPGRLLAREPAFWEHVVDETLQLYFGYDLSAEVPAVRHELVRYLLEYNGDIRALHYAITTSWFYLQSSHGGREGAPPWLAGPLKQIQVEGWIDSIEAATGVELTSCDHRLPHPEDYAGRRAREEGMGGWAQALVDFSRWELDDDDAVRSDYRDLAQTLGGCPSNEAGGRFTTVSVLNTAVQESFVAQTCGLDGDSDIRTEALLPNGVSARTALDETVAERILEHQMTTFYGRPPTETERLDIRERASQCTPAPCDAEAFARPVCFAVLSGAEMLFY